MFIRFIKSLLALALLLSAVLILLWPPRKRESTPPDFVHVQYWEKWTGDEADHMRVIIDDFNRTIGQQKKIVVDYTAMGAVDQKTLVATAGGVPPDVAGMWDVQLIQFAAKDALEPLDTLAAEYGITESAYKPIFWKGCTWNGKLWALCSTPWATFLYYNKQAFIDHADVLRQHGLDPNALPKTIDQLDRYAEALTDFETVDGKRRLVRSGFQPMEPGWYVTDFPNLWGGDCYDPKTQTLQFLSPPVVSAMRWVASYSERYGKAEVADFRAGLGGFSSDQNPFTTHQLAMEHQGPWMYNFIETLAPNMNRWQVPPEKLTREKAFKALTIGQTRAAVIAALGEPQKTDGGDAVWDAGTRTITLNFRDETLSAKRMELLPAEQRQRFCEWGCTIMPSAVPGSPGGTYCGFDALAIPRTSHHKREAFEFIAYVNRPDVAEKLAMLQCTISPLRNVSEHYLTNHPHPYIRLIEQAASGPTAFGTTQIPIFTQVYDELTNVAQTVTLLNDTPEHALAVAQARVAGAWDEYRRVAQLRRERGQP